MGANNFPHSCITPLKMHSPRSECLYGLSGSLVTLARRSQDPLTYGPTRMCKMQGGVVGEGLNM